MKLHRFVFVGLIFFSIVCSLAHAADWMPDPTLRHAISEKLGIETLTIADMQRLYRFVADGKFKADLKKIQSLKGLEHAINLKFLAINFTKVSDLTPLAGLENLRGLGLGYNRITDITPLAGLIDLEELNLGHNQISDISPLKGLVNLKILDLAENQIVDFTPIYGLTGIETLRLGLARSGIPLDAEVLQRLNPVDGPVVCEIAREPIGSRLENITYPAFVQACGDIINLPGLSWVEGIAYHDLFRCGETFGWTWTHTANGRKIIGDPEEDGISARQIRDLNPNIILLTGVDYYVAGFDDYPDDWPYFLRDAAGKRFKFQAWDQYVIDFAHPAVQEKIIQEVTEVAKCGIFDGIHMDQWTNEGIGPITYEAAANAKDRIIEGIREAVGDDFLILVTTTGDKISSKHTEYINGLYMETIENHERGYTHAELARLESTLLWAEKNLREPQINCLEGRGVRSELLDSPRNIQWMRLWTTLSLTHSDGYVLFTMGSHLDHPVHHFEFWPGHADLHARGERHVHSKQHYWDNFFEAPLGRPVGGDETKGQRYINRAGETIDGLFIREFTNGWAVYNRSGTAQEIELPRKVSGWDSGVENQRRHTLADLDGEIYLKTIPQVAPGKYLPLYWVDAQTSTLQRLSADKVENLKVGVQKTTRLAVDAAGGKLYWTEQTSQRTGKIQNANLDGRNIQIVRELTSTPLDIALDMANGKLYLTNAWGKIQRMNLDGSNFQPNLVTDLKSPQNLVLDTTNRQLYWTEQTGKTTGKIQRANLDGSNVQLVKKLTSVPRGMVLDAVNRKLYLTNAWGKLQRMNLNGSDFQPNFITGLASPGQVVVDRVGGKLYWAEKEKLRRVDLNGENIEDVITGLGELADLGLGIDSVGEMGVAAAPAAITTVVEQTQLLANYPNPFNPETWIPYHLANPSEVTITIYDMRGTLVRQLNLGHQHEGYYTSQGRAAYWDGRNAVGERVASGVYFYQLQADGLSYSRRMVIVK